MPETTDRELRQLTTAFRELRATWFRHMLKTKAYEREWESEAQELSRENDNAVLKVHYDDETEQIIRGTTRLAVAPMCPNDLRSQPSKTE